MKIFNQGNKSRKILVNKNNKMLVPESLQQHAMEWHHANLMHPGLIHAESTARQHSHWKTLREDVRKHIWRCDVCQRLKKRQTKHGLSPEKRQKPCHGNNYAWMP